MSDKPKNKFCLGDKVTLPSTGEVGVIIHYWFDKDMYCHDYLVVFFGKDYPKGPPTENPYTLRYLETTLEKFEKD